MWCARELKILDPIHPLKGSQYVVTLVVYMGTSLIKNCPPPLEPQQEPRHGPTAGSYGVAVSYKRGTPVINRLSQREEVAERGENVSSISCGAMQGHPWGYFK